MSDIFDSNMRTFIMKRVKSNENKSTELRLIDLFKELNISGWRRNYKVKGHPDFVFIKQRVAVFVDGCFCHGHNCRNTVPKNNADYWDKKRERNIKHDKEITQLFKNRGWSVLRIWECELKKKNILLTTERIKKFLRV